MSYVKWLLPQNHRKNYPEMLRCWTLICWKSTWIELRYFDPSKMTIFWKKDWGEFRDFSSCDKFVFILTTALKLVRIVKWQLLIYFYLTQIKRNLELNFKANVFWAFFSILMLPFFISSHAKLRSTSTSTGKIISTAF